MTRFPGRTLAGILALGLAACGEVAQDRQVWFTPNLASRDLQQLFQRPQQWSKARGEIDVFKFHIEGVASTTRAECPICGDNVFPNLVSAGAFARLNEWHLKVAIGAPSVKIWDCTGIVPGDLTLAAVRNVRSAGAAVSYVAMDEPLFSGRGCGQKTEETADRTAEYVARIKTAAPGIAIGDIEPYPVLTFPEIQFWLLTLRGKGAAPAFFHIDVDRRALAQHPEANVKRDLRLMRDFCQTLDIPFGVILWSDESASDEAYYNDAIEWTQTVAEAVGQPRHTIFESWVAAPDGSRETPTNLPEQGPSVFSHTRLVNDGLAILRNTRTPNPAPSSP